MNIYITHFRKIFYIVLFSSAVWFISFSIFPENQVIKIEVGDESPADFSAPRFLTVVDEQKTEELKEDARNNVAPVYSIDSKINVSVIDGITEFQSGSHSSSRRCYSNIEAIQVVQGSGCCIVQILIIKSGMQLFNSGQSHGSILRAYISIVSIVQA